MVGIHHYPMKNIIRPDMKCNEVIGTPVDVVIENKKKDLLTRVDPVFAKEVRSIHQAPLEHKLGNLHRIGSGSFTEIIGNHPHV